MKTIHRQEQLADPQFANDSCGIATENRIGWSYPNFILQFIQLANIGISPFLAVFYVFGSPSLWKKARFHCGGVFRRKANKDITCPSFEGPTGQLGGKATYQGRRISKEQYFHDFTLKRNLDVAFAFEPAQTIEIYRCGEFAEWSPSAVQWWRQTPSNRSKAPPSGGRTVMNTGLSQTEDGLQRPMPRRMGQMLWARLGRSSKY